MRTIKSILFIFAVATLSGCKIGIPKQSVFLFKDKDGLYFYDPATKKEKNIFKANDKQIFLQEPYQLSNDTLTFGIAGEFTYTDPAHHSTGENYYNDYFSVDLKTGKSWLSKKELYEVIEHKTLHIKVVSVDNNGNQSVLSDTSMVYKGYSRTAKGYEFNNFKSRFFTKHSLGDKSVFSLRGSIYYVNKFDTTLLVEYKGNFDPKFGSGYFEPQLDPTGQYVVFSYLPGFMNLMESESFQKVDIQTRKVEILKKGQFREPIFSTDGNFILFKRDQKQGKLNTWISKIYLLDLKNLAEENIGDAYFAQWGK